MRIELVLFSRCNIGYYNREKYQFYLSIREFSNISVGDKSDEFPCAFDFFHSATSFLKFL